jgi:hypothetical protein
VRHTGGRRLSPHTARRPPFARGPIRSPPPRRGRAEVGVSTGGSSIRPSSPHPVLPPPGGKGPMRRAPVAGRTVSGARGCPYPAGGTLPPLVSSMEKGGRGSPSGYMAMAAREMRSGSPSRRSHSAWVKASVMRSSGKVWETMRSNGKRLTFLRTKARAWGMAQGE